MFNFQPVVEILSGLMKNSEIEVEQVDVAIDALEEIKNTIDIEDDETIDKIDEIQDYFEYLLAIDEPSLDEVKEELAEMIKNLQAK